MSVPSISPSVWILLPLGSGLGFEQKWATGPLAWVEGIIKCLYVLIPVFHHHPSPAQFWLHSLLLLLRSRQETRVFFCGKMNSLYIPELNLGSLFSCFFFFFRQGFMGSLLQHGVVRTSNRFPCLLASWGGSTLVPYRGVEVETCPGMDLEGWLRCLPVPVVVLHAGGMPSTLLLLPIQCFCSWLFKSVVGFPGLFVSYVQNLLQLCMHRVIFSPI